LCLFVLATRSYLLIQCVGWRSSCDDEMFKREVEKLGIECCIMQYGNKINIKNDLGNMRN